MQERGPAVLPTKGPPEAAHVFSLICDAMARDMPLSCKRPALWAPGAIPTVDFLLYHPGAVVKKMGVKSQDWTRRRIPQVGIRTLISHASSIFRMVTGGFAGEATSIEGAPISRLLLIKKVGGVGNFGCIQLIRAYGGSLAPYKNLYRVGISLPRYQFDCACDDDATRGMIPVGGGRIGTT